MNNQTNNIMKIKSQSGFTLWGFLFTAAVVLFVMYVGALLVPVYTSDNAVGKALEFEVEKFSAQDLRKKPLIHKVDQKLYIDGIYEGPDLNESLEVKKTKEGIKVSLKYRKDIPLFYNIGIHLDFEHEELK